jgi:hypothetical protein
MNEVGKITNKPIQESAMKTALVLAVLLPLACLPAKGHEIQSGVVTICDTQGQVERYVQLFDGNPQVAIGAVNTEEHDPSACALVNVSYVQGPELGIVRNRAHAFQIMPIVVVGMNTPTGYRQSAPALFFTPVKVSEFAV